MTGQPKTDVKLPTNIGRYRVESILGRGGMSTVYACYDPRVGRQVAVKVLPHALLHDAMFRTRFQREAKMIASLEHPCIVPVHDFGEDRGQPYLVMRLMRGGSLTERLSAGPIPASEIEQIFRRINGALDAAHAAGIIHRDLKPGNILFDQYGNAFLSDFGIARLSTGTQASITQTGGAVGTPGYMSPEQIQGRPVDGRSDIYALGILLFEMLTGEKPFHADTPAMVIVKQMTEPVPNICDVQPALSPVYDELIHLLTAVDCEERPAKASDVTNLLKAIIDDVNGRSAAQPAPPPELPEETPPPLWTPPPKRPQPNTSLSNPAQPIIPQPAPIPNPTPLPQHERATAVHAHFSCPLCFTAVAVEKPANELACPKCSTPLPLAGHLCPFCDAYHEIESGFCENCGAAMTRICPQCDAVNWAGISTCQTCDASLDIFESLRLHDKRVAAARRQDRLEEIRYFKQIEAEASERRMAELRGDPEGLRRRAARRRAVRAVLLTLIFLTLALLALFIYNNVAL